MKRRRSRLVGTPTSHLTSSDIKLHFTLTDSWQCNHCSKKYKETNGVLSNMRKHLGSYHKEIIQPKEKGM
jgi:hypothetical protein